MIANWQLMIERYPSVEKDGRGMRGIDSRKNNSGFFDISIGRM